MSDLAEELRQKGNDAFKQRQFEAAKGYYSQAIALRDDSHLLFGNRSAACHRLQEFSQAL